MSQITLELDNELIALLRQSNQPVPEVAREMIILELYRRSAISDGKAAQLLGMSRLEFIRYAGRLGIPYFNLTDEEWQEELDAIKNL